MWTPLLAVDCCHGQRLGVGDSCWIILFKLGVARNQKLRSDLELLACFAFLRSGFGVGLGTVLQLPVPGDRPGRAGVASAMEEPNPRSAHRARLNWVSTGARWQTAKVAGAGPGLACLDWIGRRA